MEVTIRQEAGYDLALYGMSLSFKDRSIRPEDWWYFWDDESWAYDTRNDFHKLPRENSDDITNHMYRMSNVAEKNSNRGMGHNKFRRQIMLWIDVEAPRFWWSEFDTYKVGTVAQSESTMHTLMKRDLEWGDFENGIFEEVLEPLNNMRKNGHFHILKSYLPEAYLQRRLVTLNYEVLATMINQRKHHRLPQWKYFIEEIYKQVEHKELLPEYPY